MEEQEQKLGFNTRCEQFRQSLINLINHSDLPIAPVYYIVQNLYGEVEKVYYAALNDEGVTQQVTVEGVINRDSTEEQ